MNPKIFVFAAVIALGIILGGILLAGPTMVIPSQDNIPGPQNILEAKPLEIKLDNISVESISERNATIKIAFEVYNPNPRSVIVQTMDYQLFETNYSDSEQISGGEIGSRPTGMVEFGSNYYTLLGERSIILRDTITLKGSENTPQLWSILRDDDQSWKVSGNLFYNLSSMTSGQENELHFEFTN